MRKINLSSPYTSEELKREAKIFSILKMLCKISVAAILASFLLIMFCIVVGHTKIYAGISLGIFGLAVMIGSILCIFADKFSDTANIAVNLQLLTKNPHLCKKLNAVMQIPELARYTCLVREQKRDLTLCELEILSEMVEMVLSYANDLTEAKAAMLKVEQVCAEHCLNS